MRERNGREGSASVLLTCLLAGLIPVFFILYGNARCETLKNAVEWNGQNAGKAVLSYYLPQLSKQYDIYGIWKEESLLEWRMKQYIQASSPFWNGEENSGLLKARLENVKVNPEPYSLMDPEQWKKQLRTVMELGTVADLLENTRLVDSLKEVIALAGEGMTKGESAGEIKVQRSLKVVQAAANASAASAAGAAGEDGQSEESELQRKSEQLEKDRKKREAEGQKLMDSVKLRGGNILDDKEIIEKLPSRQLDLSSSEGVWDVLRWDFGQGGEFIQSSLDTDLYALHYFGSYKDEREGWFLCELEYLLQGQLSDEKNFEKTKRDLFFLRTALNLAAIYRDEAMQQWIGAMAAAMAPVPYPVAFGVIAASVSALEAGSDVKRLLQGESIPPLKSPGQWKTAENMTDHGEESVSDTGEMSYKDHLHVLLLLRPQRTKLIRMMDLVQLNLSRSIDPEFSLEECCAGFQWNISARMKDVAGREGIWECEGESCYE